jgi:hypothetical protein
MYNLNLFTDPRARLVMLTGMTILSVDAKNRLNEQIEYNKTNPKKQPENDMIDLKEDIQPIGDFKPLDTSNNTKTNTNVKTEQNKKVDDLLDQFLQ